MLNHILAVIASGKSEDTLLANVQRLAGISDSKITLLRLFNPVTDSSRSTRSVDPLDWHMRKLEGEAALNRMADKLRDTGLFVATATLEGADAEQLVQYAEANDVDLILLVKQPNTIDDLLHSVMKRATTPVVILPHDEVPAAGAATTFRRILLPLDGSQRAEITLPVATALARDADTQFIVAHVVRKPEMPRHAPPNTEETELVERIVELNRTEAERYLESFASRLPGETQRRLLVSDNIAATLYRLAEQEDVDLIVLSAHGYTGEPRWPYGSVTSSMITYSSKPVLVVQDLPTVESGGGIAPVARMYRRAR